MAEMIVTGQHTFTETKNLQVKINPESVLTNICFNLLKDKPPKAGYICDGFWYVEDGYNYHNRYEEYSKNRQATPEEMEIYNAYLVLRSAIKNG